MGQAESSLDGPAVVGAAAQTPALPSSLPSDEGSATACAEMETMLCGRPSSTGARAAPSGNGEGTASLAAVSVFCLDVSKKSLLQLRQVLETPVPRRAAAFHTLAKDSKGVLLEAPAATTLRTLQAFLLSQTSSQQPDPDMRGAEPPSAMHVFALRDPTTVVNSAEGPLVVTREMSTDLLIPLGGSLQLSTLRDDATVLGFAAPTEEEDAEVTATREAVSPTSSSSPTQRQAPRTIVLLYTRESRFGFDGGDMLLIGCCVAICACIATGICCCISAAKKKKAQSQQQQQVDNSNNYGNGNGAPNYYNNGNNNYGNGGTQYYNNGNAAGNYYGQAPQPTGNYGNPYAPGTNYNNNGAPAVGGYGTPPNAYGTDPNYQQQPQYYQQPQKQPEMNYGAYNGQSQPPGASPL